jgi:xylitol oxidase
MNKREFLRASGSVVAASMLSRMASAQAPSGSEGGAFGSIPGPLQNWAGNITYSTDRLLTPGSLEEVQQAVKTTAKMRALGSRHSFNTIADSRSAQISLKRLDQMTIDDKAKTVTVGAGIPYGKLAPYIDARGYSLQNLASLPHISVAGAIATATHGSGLARIATWLRP